MTQLSRQGQIGKSRAEFGDNIAKVGIEGVLWIGELASFWDEALDAGPDRMARYIERLPTDVSTQG